VISVEDFGAFVDLTGVQGFIHINEIAWNPFNHPSDVLKAGDKIDVQILDVSQDRGRISLSRKRLTPDPWNDVVENYSEGKVIIGKVIHLVAAGVIVQLENHVEGFLPFSETTIPAEENHYIYFQRGLHLTLKVSQIDFQHRRLSFTQKGLE
jgi:small subunit ribosomal protein S1